MCSQEQEEREFVHTPIIDVANALAGWSHIHLLVAEDDLIQSCLSRGLVVVVSDYVVSTELDTFVKVGWHFEEAFYFRADAEEFVAKQEQLQEEFGDYNPNYSILMPEEKCP